MEVSYLLHHHSSNPEDIGNSLLVPPQALQAKVPLLCPGKRSHCPGPHDLKGLLSPSPSHTLPYRAESARSRGYAFLEPVPHLDHILGTRDPRIHCPDGQELASRASMDPFPDSTSQRQTLSWVCTFLVSRSHQKAARQLFGAMWTEFGYAGRGRLLTLCKTPHGNEKILGWEEKGGLTSGWVQKPEAGSPRTTRFWCRMLRSPSILNLNLTFWANIEIY